MRLAPGAPRWLRTEVMQVKPSVRAFWLAALVSVGSFAGAHEAVTCAFVGDGHVGFAGGLHVGDGLGDEWR